jgi:hypothetical protein
VNGTQKKSLGEQWADIPFERKLAMFVAPVVVFVITGVLIPRLLGGSQPGRDEQIEIADLVPVNAPGEQTQIEISARNIGQTVSVLTRVDIEVEGDVDYVEPCAPGVVLGTSQTYDLPLPEFAEPSQVVPVVISQEVRPDDADKFALRVGVVTPSGAEPDPSIYQLRVRLFHDGKDQPVDAGQVVIAEPFPERSAFAEDYWLARDVPQEEAHDCVTDNIASMTGMLSRPGKKSAELMELAQSLQH